MQAKAEIGDSHEIQDREEMDPREAICFAEVCLARDEIKERGETQYR